MHGFETERCKEQIIMNLNNMDLKSFTKDLEIIEAIHLWTTK